MKNGMGKFLKITLLGFLFLFSKAYAATPDYKGAGSPPVQTPKVVATEKIDIPGRKYYKGEIDSNAYAASVATGDRRYSGKVFDSEFYQGTLEGPPYSPATDHSLHDGFYVGAEAGYDSYKMRHSIDIMEDGASIFQQNPELNAVGATYSLLGGFGVYFDPPLYLGTEFFYNYSQASTSQNVGLYNGEVGIYYVKSVILGTYGVSFTPGIKLADTTLLYLKGGYTRLDVKTYETSVALAINNAQSNGVNGYHFGLGLETNIYKNLSIRGEYTHLNANNFKTSVGTTVTPSNNQFMLGFIYHVL